MRTLLARFRDFYGSHPLHLLTILAGFAVVGYVLAVFKPVTLWNPQVWWQSIAVCAWRLGCIQTITASGRSLAIIAR